MARPSALPLLLLVCGASASASDAGRPTRAAMQRVLELHERSAVQVRGPRRSGPGVIVGGGGQVLTVAEHVDPAAQAQVRHEGRLLPATVLKRDGALRFALVALPQGSYPAVPVRVLPELEGQWLIGISRGPGRREQPVAGRARLATAPFFDVGMVLAPGSPLFDTQGRLVGLVVQRRGGVSRALPVGVVKGQLGAADAAP